ncbi:MAG: motility protein A [Chloroflexota bacterium]
MAENQNGHAGPSAKFDIGAPIGIFGGLTLLIFAFVLEGGSPMSLWGLSSFLIVIGGTVATLLITFPVHVVVSFPKFLKKGFVEQHQDRVELVRTFVRLAEKARRQGLLSLEDEAQQLSDPFLRDGIQEVVDGTPAEQIREILEIRISEMEARHREGIAFFENGGGFAPTMGIIGTVMGLVVTLSKLAEAGTEELGHSIAVAFIATLYGISSSNLFWLPLAQRLRKKSEAEAGYLNLMVEGILGVQAGDAPRLVRAKLEGFLSPKERERLNAPSQSEDAIQGGPVAQPAGAGA